MLDTLLVLALQYALRRWELSARVCFGRILQISYIFVRDHEILPTAPSQVHDAIEGLELHSALALNQVLADSTQPCVLLLLVQVDLAQNVLGV